MTVTAPPRAAPLLRLHPADSVVVARADVGPEADLSALGLPSPRSRIRRGHKMAVAHIAKGDAVRKYGQVIGVASADILPGEHVHLHNLAMGEAENDYAIGTEVIPMEQAVGATFDGYPRADGRAGTRNYILVISSVNCSATVSRRIAAHFSTPEARRAWPALDGVIGLTHGGGCALDMGSEGYRLLTRSIAGYAANPNVGGVLMVGLGCETNQIPILLERQGLATGDRLRTFTIQDSGGTRASVDAGVEAVAALADAMGHQKRVPVPLSALTLGLQCGGSDGYSGITANPALGVAADLLVRNGGTAVLSETPEIYGAQHLLTRRAVSGEVARKLLDRIEWWRDYTHRNGATLDNNPSFGNKQGGLTTILEKSLGAVAKGGSSPLVDVVGYGERIGTGGLIFMDTPGYDPVSATGQIAGGCNLVAFTTGRGSVSGFKPAPTVKIATNSQMYDRMSDDMDLNCGPIIEGEMTIEEAGQAIFDMLVAVASGAPTKSELLDYGDNEFVPWPMGAVL